MDMHARRYCSSLPHTYAMACVVWCPHERSWEVHLDVRLEAGDNDGPAIVSDHSMRFGPFDGLDDVRTYLQERLVTVLDETVAASEV